MAVLSGKWQFKDSIDLTAEAFEEIVDFTAVVLQEGSLYTICCTEFIYAPSKVEAVKYNIDFAIPIDKEAWKLPMKQPTYSNAPSWDLVCWLDEGFRTVDFGAAGQEVSDTFYTFVTSNAVPVTEEIPAATISYNGATIASLLPGQTATLHCADARMASDVVVQAGNGSGINPASYEGAVTML